MKSLDLAIPARVLVFLFAYLKGFYTVTFDLLSEYCSLLSVRLKMAGRSAEFLPAPQSCGLTRGLPPPAVLG